MSAKYEPELGQAIFGAPTGEFEVSTIGEAAIAHVLNEMRRVFWNRNQVRQEFGHNDGFEYVFSPELAYQSYVWCSCDGDDPHCDCRKPNLAFNGVEVRWYKYFGRGMSCNRDMMARDWDEWLNAAMDHLRSLDAAR